MTEQGNYSDKACKNLCGFFGSESNDGYCSVCYKQHIKEKEQKAESAAGSRGGSPNSSGNRQSLSSDCIISGSPGHVASLPADTGQAPGSRVSPSRKVSLSDVACKIRQEALPLSPRAQEVPPMSALKSGSGMPGYQETFEIPIEEEYEEDNEDFQEANRSVLQSCNERCQTARADQTPALFAEDSNKSSSSNGESKLEDSTVAEAESLKRKANRCGVCNKKLGLTDLGFKCRCGGQFCSIHRYSDKHECSFDYKEYGQRQIRKNNPVVSGEKISKI